MLQARKVVRSLLFHEVFHEVALLGAATALSTALAVACQREKSAPPGPTATVPAEDTARGALSPELAARVLARVGDRSITLGDYVSALERMDPFERLRYQTPERRKALLDEMINVELLAREAERRGLDKEPATQAHLQQLMRDALLRRLRDAQPSLEEISEGRVREYYRRHLQDFNDPERRRVAVIAVADRNKAEAVLKELRELQPGDARRWGELVREHSVLTSSEKTSSRQTKGGPESARSPLELEGDLGLVSPPGDERGKNPKVPEPVREAVFKIAAQGEVFSEVVAAGGHHYVVRLLGVSPARQRSYEEAETTIRVKLMQEAVREAEAKLEAELREKIPVRINEAALQELQLPEPAVTPLPKATPGATPSALPKASSTPGAAPPMGSAQ